ncbi:hypothetical protein DFJ73DRAFT_892374 [Zopfochytrium polystomum]|nr:hypothetical protein DFJ73DRAFT_892374 [Zopfochytrium polystomum]
MSASFRKRTAVPVIDASCAFLFQGFTEELHRQLPGTTSTGQEHGAGRAASNNAFLRTMHSYHEQLQSSSFDELQPSGQFVFHGVARFVRDDSAAFEIYKQVVNVYEYRDICVMRMVNLQRAFGPQWPDEDVFATPLVVAMFSGNADFVRFLLAACSDRLPKFPQSDFFANLRRAVDSQGNTCLHLAAQYGLVEFLELLVPFIRKEPAASDALDCPNLSDRTPYEVALNDEARACFLLDYSIQDVNILVVGPSQHGKSSFIRQLMRCAERPIETIVDEVPVGDGNESTTAEPKLHRIQGFTLSEFVPLVGTDQQRLTKRKLAGFNLKRLIEKLSQRGKLKNQEDLAKMGIATPWMSLELVQLEFFNRRLNVNIIDTPGLVDTEEGRSEDSDAIGDNHMHKVFKFLAQNQIDDVHAVILVFKFDCSLSTEIRSAVEYYSRTFGKDPSLFHVVLGNFLMQKRVEAILKKEDLEEKGLRIMRKLGLSPNCNFYLTDTMPSPLAYTECKLVDYKSEFFANDVIHRIIARIWETGKTQSLCRQDLIFYKTRRMVQLDKLIIGSLESHCDGFTKGIAVNNKLLEEVMKSISEKSVLVTREKLTISNLEKELGEKDNDGDPEFAKLNHFKAWRIIGHRHTFDRTVPPATPISRVKLHRPSYNYWESVSLDATPVAALPGGSSNQETWDVKVDDGRTPLRFRATACSNFFAGIAAEAVLYVSNRRFFAQDIRELRFKLKAARAALKRAELELDECVNDRRVKESHMEECVLMVQRIGTIKAFLSEPHVRAAGGAFDCLQAIYARQGKTATEDIAALFNMVQAEMAR